MTTPALNSLTSNRARNRWGTRFALALAITLTTLTLFTAPASAWTATPSGSFICVKTESGFGVGLKWSVTSWRPGEVTGENPSISLEASLDSGPFASVASGAFTTSNNGTFTGLMPVPDGTRTIELSAFASAAWADGTVDPTPTHTKLTVLTLEEIGDPACLPAEPTPKPQPTATPAPTVEPTVIPTVEPTPTPQVLGEKVTATPTPGAAAPTAAPSAPATSAPPEVLGRQLARTGSDSSATVVIAVGLVALGLGAHFASRRLARD